MWARCVRMCPNLFDSVLGGLASRERDEGVASIGAGHRVHHQSQIPNGAALLEQRNEFVLEHVFGDFAAKHFAADARRAGVPVRWRTTILALAC